MLFAYLSLDEVNKDLARQLATKVGGVLEALSFRIDARAVPFDALVYDLDSLPTDYRSDLLTQLLEVRRRQPRHRMRRAVDYFLRR